MKPWVSPSISTLMSRGVLEGELPDSYFLLVTFLIEGGAAQSGEEEVE